MLIASEVKCRLGEHEFHWNFSCEQASWTAVIGESGVGKSTLLNVLLGFQECTAKELSWQKNSMLGVNVSQRPFGVLFQKDNLFEHLSVQKNLSLGLQPSARLTEEERALVHAAAERFQIQTLLKKKASDLSGGQQQRVALARVFLQNKPILLLDEPFSSLDPGLRQEGIEWVKEMQSTQQSTVIMVTHHLSEISDYADSIFEGVSSRQWTQYPAKNSSS